ncbi:MAG TPA: hypothetical protein PKA95_03300 [Thermomicrobiales bacterium]|nr:hypothetical protein [Thermomicrobiales bacterium]
MRRLTTSRSILLGLLLSALTVGISVAIESAGLLSGRWGWVVIAFALSLAEVLILGALAAIEGPFEPRLRRWDVPRDPLAIGFQLDLAAAEQNPPSTIGVGAAWLWIGLAPLVTTIVLGITLI